jgi:hypothetical protein
VVSTKAQSAVKQSKITAQLSVCDLDIIKCRKVKIYKTIILPVVLYGRETGSLTLREEHRLRAFENRVLRRIFGPKRDDVTGEWRKLHSEELHNCTHHQISLGKSSQGE